IEDFVRVFEDASGVDLAQFSLWYHQAGTPNVTVAARHDPARAELVLDIEQNVPPTPSESRKRAMHIPLRFALIGADGAEIGYESTDAAVADGRIHLKKRRQSVRLTGISERPVLSLNRGFSAPVTLSVEQSDADRLFLA